MDCIGNLVGLSESVPVCFTGSAPSGYNTSVSGYFIKDSDYGMRVMDGCDFDGWAILEEAKRIGISNFKTDFRNALYQNFTPSFTPYSGLIGKTTHSGVNTNFVKPYGGLEITCDGNQRGMYLAIKNIFLGLNISDEYDVTIKSNSPEFTPITRTLNATALSYRSNTQTPEILLPLYDRNFYDDSTEYLKYYIEVSYGAAKPLNGNITCCGEGGAWRNICDVNGYAASTNGLTFVDLSSQNNGVVLDAYLKCDDLEFICTLAELNGYQTLDVIARAIQFRSGIAAYGLFLDRNLINTCTMYNREEINAHRKFLTEKYAEYIDFIVQNIPPASTSCLKCKDGDVFIKANILL